jgi:hypothetical protein
MKLFQRSLKVPVLFSPVLMLLFFSCKKEPTSWHSDWSIALMSDTIFVASWINDSTLAENSDQSVQVQLDRMLFNVNVFDLIAIPDTTIVQDFSINFSSLNIPPGTAYVDEVKEHFFDLGDIVLKKARLRSGKANITISNPLATTTIFEIELPGVVRDGVTFSQTELVAPAQNGQPGKTTIDLDLGGFFVDMRGENGQFYNTFQSRMKVSTDPNGPAVTFSNTDVVKFEINFGNLSVDYALGYLGETTISDTVEVDVEALSKIIQGEIALQDMFLELQLVNGIRAIAQGKITHVEAVNAQGQSINLSHPQLNLPFNINAAQGNWNNLQPFVFPFLFDENNSNIKAFLEHLGFRYRIGYEVKINPWGNTSGGTDEIFPNSKLALQLQTDFPLTVGANGLLYRDTFAFDFANDNRLLRVNQGQFVLKTKNAFPFALSTQMKLLNEQNETLITLEQQGEINAANPNVSNDEIIFIINSETAKLLQETKFIQLDLTLNSASMQDNKVFVSDFLAMELKAFFQLKTNVE